MKTKIKIILIIMSLRALQRGARQSPPVWGEIATGYRPRDDVKKDRQMKKKFKTILLVVLVTILVVPTLVGATRALAAQANPEVHRDLADGGYEINWWTIDGGGGESESAGGEYSIKGTIGQPDASNKTEGGTYALRGGFWVEGILSIFEYLINLPLVLR
jgi:hypothetical protein